MGDPRENSNYDPVRYYGIDGAKLHSEAIKRDKLPSFARGAFHFCPSCETWKHTLCPDTHKSENAMTVKHRIVCGTCGAETNYFAKGNKPCADCVPSMEDWDPSSPKNLATRVEAERKWQEERRIQKERDDAWKAIPDLLIDLYLDGALKPKGVSNETKHSGRSNPLLPYL